MAKVVLEASRVAAEKMLDYYRRMDIEVTPEITLAPEKPMGVEPTVRYDSVPVWRASSCSLHASLHCKGDAKVWPDDTLKWLHAVLPTLGM